MGFLRINVVLSEAPGNTALARRLDVYAARAGELLFAATPVPLPEAETDCYAVQADRVRELTVPEDRPATWRPVIAFGPPEMLRAAFIDGATDFMREPWTPEELHFRAVQRCRSRSSVFGWGRIELDGQRLTVRFNDTGEADGPEGSSRTVRLGPKEATVLETLLAFRGEPVSRELLFYAMWGRSGTGSRAVDMQIHELREVLGRVSPDLGGDRLVHSVYGFGYAIG